MRCFFAVILHVGVAGVLTVAALAQEPTPGTDCRTWQECRDLALEAAARGDHESFHDLAWRTVQTGPPKQTDLMYLLARAQSLSGRPHDALVMLRRIVELGVHATDALTSNDFTRVRNLPEWAEVEALIAGTAAPAPPAVTGGDSAASTSAAVPPATAPAPRASGASPPAASAPDDARTRVAASAVVTSSTGTTTPSAVAPAEEVLRFRAGGFLPSGMGVDAVSERYLFSDGSGRRVVIVREDTGKVVDLVRAEAAGFDEVLALEIDARRGDLWVASSAIHKLQLVSGRPLATIAAPPGDRPVRFSDLAVSSAGELLALDSEGHRVWRLRPKGLVLEVAAELEVDRPVSIALSESGRFLYVAHDGGVARVDLTTGRNAALQVPEGLSLSGIDRVRSYNGALVAVQRTTEGPRRIVRLRLDRAGRRVVAADSLEVALPGDLVPGAVTVSGGDFYYVARIEPATGAVDGQNGTGAVETVVRRVRLR